MSVEYNYIVRILGNDIPGDKKMVIALTQIKGVGYMFANSIINNLKIAVVRKPNEVYDAVPATTNCKPSNP